MFLYHDNRAQTITVLRKGATDWAGDLEPGELGESHTIDNVLVAWDTTSENDFRREETVTTGYLYMSTGSDILATDRVELQTGETVSVAGKPFIASLGLVSGMKVKFRVVG